MGEVARLVVDLDAVLDAEVVDEPGRQPVRVPTVVVDAPPPHRIEDSPLYGRTRLEGRIVTDPAECARIGREIAAARRRGVAGWWRRRRGR